MKKDSIIMRMSDGKKIVVHRWMPDKKTPVIGLIQLSHGMIEYAMRYDAFGEQLAEKGFVLYAHDHRGHGETAETADELGYLADVDGFQRVVLDLREVLNRLKADYPGHKAFIFAHSFGSFVAQSFIEQFPCDIDGCILAGTAGPRKALITTARIVCRFLMLFGGKKRRSKFMAGLSFSGYNSRFDKSEGSRAWLSRDLEYIAKDTNNVYCTFTPTLAFYSDMLTGLNRIHKQKNIRMIPKALPVLFLTGTDDPVGSYTNTVRKLADIYKKNGMTEVSFKTYEGARHELLNETNKVEVIADIFEWLNAQLERNKRTKEEPENEHIELSGLKELLED